MLKILIADDHTVLRQTLSNYIGSQTDMCVIGEAADGLQAIEKAVSLQPDVAILDITMPNCGGLQALRQLRKKCPDVNVLMLTMHDDPTFMKSVAGAGGRGYVCKKAAGEELLDAIREVARGETHFADDLDLSEDDDASPMIPPEDLSPREREVLGWVAYGHTNRAIATKIGISEKSIGTYRLRLCEKLKVKSRAELVQYAITHGLLVTEPSAETN